METYDKIKKTLAVAFMHDLDNNRPEWKMCLSNGECADIEKAFDEQDWSKLARYLDKYTESEDERIRKFLIDILSSGTWKKEWPFSPADCVAYLEKQKEQKPPVDVDPCDASCNAYYQRGLNKGYELGLEAGRKERNTVKFEEGFKTGRESGLRDGQNYVLNNLDSYGLCKPAEWSERYIADIFEKVGLAKIVREQGNNALTNALQDAMLELSKAGNTEWSEEDEKMLTGIIERGSSHIPLYEQALREEQMEWFMNRLKSLRPKPHWKPSEYTLSLVKKIADGEMLTCMEQMALGTLYEQLKKL